MDVRIFGLLIGDFNPRSPCGERRRNQGRVLRLLPISTLAPLAGSDIRGS